jgi:hypothetical protein
MPASDFAKALDPMKILGTVNQLQNIETNSIRRRQVREQDELRQRQTKSHEARVAAIDEGSKSNIYFKSISRGKDWKLNPETSLEVFGNMENARTNIPKGLNLVETEANKLGLNGAEIRERLQLSLDTNFAKGMTELNGEITRITAPGAKGQVSAIKSAEQQEPLNQILNLAETAVTQDEREAHVLNYNNHLRNGYTPDAKTQARFARGEAVFQARQTKDADKLIGALYTADTPEEIAATESAVVELIETGGTSLTQNNAYRSFKTARQKAARASVVSSAHSMPLNGTNGAIAISRQLLANAKTPADIETAVAFKKVADGRVASRAAVVENTAKAKVLLNPNNPGALTEAQKESIRGMTDPEAILAKVPIIGTLDVARALGNLNNTDASNRIASAITKSNNSTLKKELESISKVKLGRASDTLDGAFFIKTPDNEQKALNGTLLQGLTPMKGVLPGTNELVPAFTSTDGNTAYYIVKGEGELKASTIMSFPVDKNNGYMPVGKGTPMNYDDVFSEGFKTLRFLDRPAQTVSNTITPMRKTLRSNVVSWKKTGRGVEFFDPKTGDILTGGPKRALGVRAYQLEQKRRSMNVDIGRFRDLPLQSALSGGGILRPRSDVKFVKDVDATVEDANLAQELMTDWMDLYFSSLTIDDGDIPRQFADEAIGASAVGEQQLR